MTPDFGNGLFLRQARPDDRDALSAICLKTGNSGKDATATEDDPTLLGLIYAVPYQVLEPDFAFVIDGLDGVAGYVLGTPDTKAFNARLAGRWYPELQAREPDPGANRSQWRGSDWARHRIHHPDFSLSEALAPYPSHGHIDLLAAVRGKGIGRRAIAFLERRLVEAGSPGIHFEVSPQNADALDFYAALGFAIVFEADPSGRFTYVAKRLG